MSMWVQTESESTQSEQDNTLPQAQQKAEAPKPKRQIQQFSSEEEDQKRKKIVSKKQAMLIALRETTWQIKSKVDINDYVQCYQLYVKLNEIIKKYKTLIEQDGYPSCYIRIVFKLTNIIQNFSQEKRNELNANNNKHFTSLKTQLTKNNVNINNELKKFEEDPTNTTEEEFDSDQSDSFDQSDSQASINPLESNDPMERRKFWLKKVVKKKQESESDSDEIIQQEAGQFTFHQKEKYEIQVDYEEEKINEYLYKLEGQRVNMSKKKLEESAYVAEKYKLHKKDFEFQAEINCVLLALSFDLLKSEDKIIQNQDLQCFLQYIEDILEITKSQREISYRNFKVQEKNQNLDDLKQIVLRNLLILSIEIDNFFKQYDQTTSEYEQFFVQLLKYQKLINIMLKQIQNDTKYIKQTAQLALIKVKYIYYQRQEDLKAYLAHAQESNLDLENQFYNEEDIANEVNRLCQKIYREDRTNLNQVLLYNSYSLSINDNFQKAKELFQQVNLQNPQLEMQSLFNRALVQLGLSAFREGNIYEAYNLLAEICKTARVKELISQSLPKFEIEGTFYICQMLVETVKICQNKDEKNSHNKFIKQQQQNLYTGCPDSFRDYTYQATLCLMKGDFQNCLKNIYQMNFWKFIQQNKQDIIKQNLTLQVKIIALKCYIQMNKEVFLSMNLQSLENQFQLSKKQVQKVVFGAIINQELKANVSNEGEELLLIFERQEMDGKQAQQKQLIQLAVQRLQNNEELMKEKIKIQEVQVIREQEEEANKQKKKKKKKQ